MVKFLDVEYFYEELEKMIVDVEDILKKLYLFYCVMVLLIGDMGFFVVKIYDLEVWIFV